MIAHVCIVCCVCVYMCKYAVFRFSFIWRFRDGIKMRIHTLILDDALKSS